MLADLVIGWLQEEVLLSMYARFAMQPAVIPDATTVEPEDEEQDLDGAQRRRRLTSSSAAGITDMTAQEEDVRGSGLLAVQWMLAQLPSPPWTWQQRHQQASDAAQQRQLFADIARHSSNDEGRDGSGVPAVRWPLERRSRTGWRYRRRKDAFEDNSRIGRKLSQFLDAAKQHTAGSDEPPNPVQQHSSLGQKVYHRRRQRQQQQPQPQEVQKDAADIHSSGGGDDAGQLRDALYPDLPPPMFAQNAGADARRCWTGP
jgi:hypothetical protein